MCLFSFCTVGLSRWQRNGCTGWIDRCGGLLQWPERTGIPESIHRVRVHQEDEAEYTPAVPRALTDLVDDLIVVPEVGLEPTRPESQRILNPPRMPIPPLRPGS